MLSPVVMTEVNAGQYSLKGVSLGGIHTSIYVPGLQSLFDVGMAFRSAAAARNLFLSHAHADHSGALIALLGMRGLLGNGPPLKIFLPKEIEKPLAALISDWSKLQRYPFNIKMIAMEEGTKLPLSGNLQVEAFKTFHPVPSLGYRFVRVIDKLRTEFSNLPGKEIAARKKNGDDLFYQKTRCEFAFATDTLISVLDHTPSLYETEVLVLECTFLDKRKTLKDSRAGCHIHLDEILERQDLFKNEQLVLMHFSQLYQPSEIREILQKRCSPELFERIVVFAPPTQWPG